MRLVTFSDARGMRIGVPDQESNIIVDLSGVTFLSSVGIRALVANGKSLKTNGGKMVLVVGENAAVSKTLKTTCTDALLPMFNNLDSAQAALSS